MPGGMPANVSSWIGVQLPMAFALYHGGFIAVHVFRQDEAVARVRLVTPPHSQPYQPCQTRSRTWCMMGCKSGEACVAWVQLVEIYTQGMLPGLLPYILSCVIMKTLQAQNLMWAPAYVTVSMFFINIGFNSLLISTWGFSGAAYAQSASRIAQFLLLVGACLPRKQPCPFFSPPCLTRCTPWAEVPARHGVEALALLA